MEPGTSINNLCAYPNSGGSFKMVNPWINGALLSYLLLSNVILGLIFMATEAPKMLIYYIPVSGYFVIWICSWCCWVIIDVAIFIFQSLGPAPRWCSFLDSLTEELEEDSQPAGIVRYLMIATFMHSIELTGSFSHHFSLWWLQVCNQARLGDSGIVAFNRDQPSSRLYARLFYRY